MVAIPTMDESLTRRGRFGVRPATAGCRFAQASLPGVHCCASAIRARASALGESGSKLPHSKAAPRTGGSAMSNYQKGSSRATRVLR